MTRKVKVTGKPQRKIKPKDFAAALGAEPIGKSHKKNLDPTTLGEMGSKIIKAARKSNSKSHVR